MAGINPPLQNSASNLPHEQEFLDEQRGSQPDARGPRMKYKFVRSLLMITQACKKVSFFVSSRYCEGENCFLKISIILRHKKL